MMLTMDQQKKVEENIGLVGKVMKDKVHGCFCRIYGYDDLFQIGCVGLCKAAATDRGGHFSTYAYDLIWHEICDALRYAARRENTEVPIVQAISLMTHEEDEAYSDIQFEIIQIRERAAPSIRKGIDAILLMDRGYSLREIGKRMDAAPNLVSAWASKARKHLKKTPLLAASGDR